MAKEKTEEELRAMTYPGRLSRALAKLEQQLKTFDYFYNHSDDHQVWQAGNAHDKVIIEMCQDLVKDFPKDGQKKVVRLWKKLAPDQYKNSCPVAIKKPNKPIKQENIVPVETQFSRRRELSLPETLNENDSAHLANLLASAVFQHWNNQPLLEAKSVSVEEKIGSTEDFCKDPKWLKENGIEPFWLMTNCKAKREKKFKVDKLDVNHIALAKQNLAYALRQAPVQTRLTYLIEESLAGRVDPSVLLKECGPVIHRAVVVGVSNLKDKIRFEATQKAFEESQPGNHKSNGSTKKFPKEPKTPKVPGQKREQGKDGFECRLGSQAAMINACVTSEPKTTEQIMKESGQSKSRCQGNLSAMASRGYVLKLAGNKWQLVAGGHSAAQTTQASGPSNAKKAGAKGKASKGTVKVAKTKVAKKGEKRGIMHPAVSVKVFYDSVQNPGTRVVKKFEDSKQAKNFFVKMDKTGRNPKIKHPAKETE